MQGFQRKTISSLASLGSRIKAARKKKKISLAKAEQETKIRAHYLEAIETNSFSRLPASHRKGFIRRYARYLNIPTEIVETELEDQISNAVSEDLFSPKRLHRETRWVITPRMLLVVLGILLLLTFIGYVSYQIKQFASPPQLAINKPANETVVSTESITIEGTTDPGSNVFIDNLQVSTDASGNFNYPIVLRPGLNQIIIRSVNTIKKETTKSVSVLYQAPAPSPTPSPTPTPTPSPTPSLQL